jgi:hypothetical protein
LSCFYKDVSNCLNAFFYDSEVAKSKCKYVIEFTVMREKVGNQMRVKRCAGERRRKKSAEE